MPAQQFDSKHQFYPLEQLRAEIPPIDDLPISLRVLIENLLRHDQLDAQLKAKLANWHQDKNISHEINYLPNRVLMQDFTGVPAVADLVAMRDAVADMGGDVNDVNPIAPVDLVIDHSVMVDQSGHADALKNNVELEFQRNEERYKFLKWGQQAFDNFRVVPPGMGICHQVNLEYLAPVVFTDKNYVLSPDTLVGTDSHTTMINALGILGWGVGGIEAEAVMLGQPIPMVFPQVIGVKIFGSLNEGITATDLVLTITNILREYGVVGKFVEFFGQGLDSLSLADRATISNMAPEYGATCGFFPIDNKTLDYLRLTNRDVELVEQYIKKQGLWRNDNLNENSYNAVIEVDLTTITPALAGPKRPQDKINLEDVASQFINKDFIEISGKAKFSSKKANIKNGDIAIAAITSCTNTSNPSVLIAAGLLAKKAQKLGLKVPPWVKTSFAPGSQVASDYLEDSGLQKCLNDLGFNVVGYGCTTCIGNSGGLLTQEIEQTVVDNDLLVCSVLSGNRNFEGRVNQLVKANYLASPPLVVAYALAGSITVDLGKDPIGIANNGRKVYLQDVWPTNEEIEAIISQSVKPQLYKQRYDKIFSGTQQWQQILVANTAKYNWDHQSTYVQQPPFFTATTSGTIADIKQANILALLGDSVTTDHISPAGAIKADSPAGLYLTANGVDEQDFNSYGSRRGNHEVMMRGTFANIRLRNLMLKGDKTGGYTICNINGEEMSIYDAAMLYQQHSTPLVVIAGKEYGTGSSRDWAAKGTSLLGVKAVIAQSFERIHRSNLVGMGVLPLEFTGDDNAVGLELTGKEKVSITGLSELRPSQLVDAVIEDEVGNREEVKLLSRVDTDKEVEYVKFGGILPYMARKMVNP
jgi:aconitate hydratase